ncbi:MAG: formylglycine-generating enzyme family protein [Anaerolineae bacterium]|nr:formylglycine-generating enzyme family protein [Anaerolineae bacterium]
MRSIIFILVLLLLVSCASTTDPNPVAAAIRQNDDWTPLIQEFDGVEMVQVPPGCFTMGSSDGRRDERPPNQQCFTSSFWVDRYEVSNVEYGSSGHFDGDLRPRENLTWFEARDFCARRGARLPTEAEWEYAARGPDNLIYPWGNRFIDAYLQYDRRSEETADVNKFPGGASWVGALNLSGNVWEWVSSAYKPYPYDAADGRENVDDATVKRVFRGGWLSYQDGGTSAVMRFRLEPDGRDWHLGFRCARSGE